MTQQDEKERKNRGVSAASSALSALSDLVQATVTVKRVTVDEESSKPHIHTYKDHEMKPIDKLIGPTGLFRGFRILILLTVLIVFVFFKVNQMISEIPSAVQRASDKNVSETLTVQSGNGGNSAMLVSPGVSTDLGIVKNDKGSTDSETVKRLRGEVESLNSQLDSLSKKPDGVHKLDESVGMVRDDHLMRLLQERGEIGQVKSSHGNV